MLESGERIDNHDRVCCEQYASLLAMGAYDEEFALFGIAYFTEGRRKCYISMNREKVYQFFDSCCERQIYPTVVEAKIRRLRVHSGERPAVEQRLKLEFAYELSQKYSHAFLSDLQKMALCPVSNKAADILSPLQEHLEGCFDEDALQLFAGAVKYAYAGKILTSAQYYSYQAWLKQERDFLDEKTHPASHFKRTLAGLAYLEHGKVKYYTNALLEKVQSRRLEIMSHGQMATPIFTKTYYFNSYAELPGCLQKFDRQIAQKVDDNYLSLITDLHSLTPEMDAAAYQAFAQDMQRQSQDRGILNTLTYYQMLWHIA